jgi:hypothetical protein
MPLCPDQPQSITRDEDGRSVQRQRQRDPAGVGPGAADRHAPGIATRATAAPARCRRGTGALSSARRPRLWSAPRALCPTPGRPVRGAETGRSRHWCPHDRARCPHDRPRQPRARSSASATTSGMRTDGPRSRHGVGARAAPARCLGSVARDGTALRPAPVSPRRGCGRTGQAPGTVSARQRHRHGVPARDRPLRGRRSVRRQDGPGGGQHAPGFEPARERHRHGARLDSPTGRRSVQPARATELGCGGGRSWHRPTRDGHRHGGSARSPAPGDGALSTARASPRHRRRHLARASGRIAPRGTAPCPAPGQPLPGCGRGRARYRHRRPARQRHRHGVGSVAPQGDGALSSASHTARGQDGREPFRHRRPQDSSTGTVPARSPARGRRSVQHHPGRGADGGTGTSGTAGGAGRRAHSRHGARLDRRDGDGALSNPSATLPGCGRGRARSWHHCPHGSGTGTVLARGNGAAVRLTNPRQRRRHGHCPLTVSVTTALSVG